MSVEGEIVVHAAYVVIVLGLPGTMFWRRLTGGSGWLTVDIFLGACCGVALECLLYPLGRWLGMPLLPLVMPLVAVILTAIPGHRPPRGRLLPWWSIAGVAAAVGVVVLWFVRAGSQFITLEGPAANRPNSDTPYQLALAAELTHHFPPQVPYVAGESLSYHWMVYNHIASAHWITRAELDVLVSRTVPLELTILAVLGIAATAVVLSGKVVAAPLAALLSVLAADFSPWSWSANDGQFTDGPLAFTQMISTTQALAAALVLPLIALTALMFRRRPTAGDWVVALVLISVLSVSKASMLPLYGAGLAVAFLYLLLRHRRLSLPTLGLAVLVAACYGANYVLVLGSQSHGVIWAPAETFRSMLKRLLPTTFESGSLALLVLFSAWLVAAWLLPSLGSLLISRERPDDPMPALLGGAVLSGVAVTSLVWQYSMSQLFFIRGTFGFGVLLAAWGLASLRAQHLAMAVPAATVGVGAVLLGRSVVEGEPWRCADNSCVETAFAAPPLVITAAIAAGVLILGLILLMVLRKLPARAWAALMVASALGATFSTAPAAIAAGGRPVVGKYESIAPGGIEAARYIRANGGSQDVIATNVHCQRPVKPPCVSMSFWVAGYSERRVLVEGWAYTARSSGRTDRQEALAGEFWDPELLRANDVVFTGPSIANLEYLRKRYGVRWLLLDERVNPAPGALDELADLRFRAGTVRVYELRIAPTPNTNPDLPN
ncbi:hypothetical protein [Kribbella deserti]|uniref:Uncharacterized protein n=1 Tax=Kribbella deserti TaxID=1926257 RepID=A0ABV6QST0_9ACTN